MKEKQVTFSIKDSLEKLKKSMDGLSTHAQDSVNSAIQGIAEAAYASITARAQAELHKTRQDFLNSLNFEKLEDGSFLISLDGDFANKIEDGYSSYNMVPGMLASNKSVQVGSRAGQPWVKNTKPKGKDQESHKYAHVPIQHQPHAKAAQTSNMADAMKSLVGRNARGDLQSMLKTFKGDDGRPMEGKVAVAHSESVQDPRLAGLVKYQKVHKGANGKERVQSVYIAYRTISENGKPWIHPGFKGLHAFADAEKEIAKQVEDIIKDLL